MKPISFRRVFIISAFSILALVYTLLWLRMISSPSERTGSDFISPYSAARVAQRWGASHVYDLEYQQVIQADVVGFPLVPGQVLMFNHPPFLLSLLLLLVNGNYVASLLRYTLLMLFFYAASAFVISWLLRREGWQKRTSFLLLAGLLTFYPLFVSLINAQDTAIMVFGVLLILSGLLTGRDWLSGIGLALTSVRPHVTLLLAVPFLFRRQKVFLWFFFSALFLGLVSLLAVDLSGIQAFLRNIILSAGGDYYGLHESAMVNLVGLLLRLFPGMPVNTVHAIGWVVYGLSLLGLCFFWLRSPVISYKQFMLALPVAAFAAPHLHYHDLTLLLPAILSAIIYLAKTHRLSEQTAVLIPPALSLALLLSGFIPALKYNIPYLLMLPLALLPFLDGKIMHLQAVTQ